MEQTTSTLTRAQINDLIKSKKDQILLLNKEIIELNNQSLLLSDETQWFDEKMETVTIRDGRKKLKVGKLIGRIHWKEDFIDQDTGDVITVVRSQIVRVDGNWDW